MLDTRPISARVSLSSLSNNLDVARHAAGGARIMAVVKANGYGHGLSHVAQALSDADGFAVLRLEEAMTLRELGVRAPILLLEGFFSPQELPVIAEHGLSIVIHNALQLEALALTWLPVQVEVFLKINTGMNRLGFSTDRVDEALNRLRQIRHVGRITLMTHFATADDDHGVSDQLSRFQAVLAEKSFPISLANSAALLRYPETRGDWVRPGIMLYGASPFADCNGGELGLEPVMTLTSAIIGVQEIKSGDAVGYGHTFHAKEPMRIGIVACGYADGYPRHAPTGTPLLVGGEYAPLVGRVSMDMLTVDLSHLPRATVGSPVTLWGEGLPVEEVARAAGTISYELLCAVAPRVPLRIT